MLFFIGSLGAITDRQVWPPLLSHRQTALFAPSLLALMDHLFVENVKPSCDC